jgi:uncharacterized protein YndB with AHSA1/START domain
VAAEKNSDDWSASAPPGTCEVVISRLINAPRDLVWKAYTDPAHVAQWWGPNGFTTTIEAMDVRVGGVMNHVMHGPDGANYPNRSVYTEVVKPERIAYTVEGGLEGGRGVSFVATWTFEAVGEKTLVTGRSVFATEAERDFVVKEFGAVEGGKQHLARLNAYAGLTPAEQQFVVTRVLRAAPELVWQAWSTAEALAQWWGPKDCDVQVLHLDFVPGGTFHYSMQWSGQPPMWGRFVYREMQAPRRIEYLNAFADAQGHVVRAPFPGMNDWPLEVLNTVTFEAQGSHTLMTIRSGPVCANEAERAKFAGFFDSMRGGYSGTMEQLEQFLSLK